MKPRYLPALALAAIATCLATFLPARAADPAPAQSAAERHRQGVQFHLQRRLDEASREYAQTLALEPSRPPSSTELDLIRRFAPRVMTHPADPFPLKDLAAIHHPTEPVIAYHFFWDDDLDFPDDNDPCDHEVVWVRYAPDGQSLEGFWTYFHDRILEGGPTALDDARAHQQRPRVLVQWGKHGSMPLGWEHLTLPTSPGDPERNLTNPAHTPLLEYNRTTWNRLATQGRRALAHPMARREGWPEKFPGTFEQFIDFSRPVDLIPFLDRRRLVAVSRWNSAVINQEFLAYNFRPKTEWPPSALAPSRIHPRASTPDTSPPDRNAR